MDQYTFFAIAAVIVTAIRYGTYFHTIYLGKTKPHAFSWLIWSALNGVGALAQFNLGAGPAAWTLAFFSLSSLLIAVISFFNGSRDYTHSDWLALGSALLAIPLWKITENPVLALALIISINAISTWPTIRKSFHKPDTEPPISYLFSGLRHLFMLFAVSNPTWQTLMYPLYLLCISWGIVIYIVIRRAQLGLPLHEYARK